MAHGTGKHRYEAIPGWGAGKNGRIFGGVVTGIAAGPQDRVYIARRKPPAILVYTREGEYVSSWGEKLFTNPHGVSACADSIWVADSSDHTVRRLDLEGNLVQVLGTSGRPGKPGEPFNRPTKAVPAPNGELFVSDGYGQCRVHRYSESGELLQSWGSEGVEPGQFFLPHSVAVDAEDGVFVADRENSRIQVFTREGAFLSQWSARSWPALLWPNDLCIGPEGEIYVAEAGHRLSIWRRADAPPASPIKTPAGQWEMLARWGDFGSEAGQFLDCPHCISIDSRGDLYIGEVPFTPNRVQKFRRIP